MHISPRDISSFTSSFDIDIWGGEHALVVTIYIFPGRTPTQYAVYDTWTGGGLVSSVVTLSHVCHQLGGCWIGQSSNLTGVQFSGSAVGVLAHAYIIPNCGLSPGD